VSTVLAGVKDYGPDGDAPELTLIVRCRAYEVMQEAFNAFCNLSQ